MAFLSSKMSLDDLQYLFIKIKTLPLSEIDKFCLGLVRSIARKIAGDEEKHDDYMSGSAVAGGTQFRSSSLQRGFQGRQNQFK